MTTVTLPVKHLHPIEHLTPATLDALAARLADYRTAEPAVRHVYWGIFVNMLDARLADAWHPQPWRTARAVANALAKESDLSLPRMIEGWNAHAARVARAA